MGSAVPVASRTVCNGTVPRTKPRKVRATSLALATKLAIVQTARWKATAAAHKRIKPEASDATQTSRPHHTPKAAFPMAFTTSRTNVKAALIAALATTPPHAPRRDTSQANQGCSTLAAGGSVLGLPAPEGSVAFGGGGEGGSGDGSGDGLRPPSDSAWWSEGKVVLPLFSDSAALVIVCVVVALAAV